MATFEQIKIAVKLLPEFINRGDLGDYLLTRAVNDTQRRFHQDLNSRFEEKTGTTIVTISGTRDYTLPTDYKAMHSVFYRKSGATDKAILTRRDKEWFDANYSDPASTGTPADWMLWSGSLRIGPTPNLSTQDLLLDYLAFKADLADVSPNNTNDFTVQFDQALRWGAAQDLGMYAGLPLDRVGAFATLYTAALTRARRQVTAEEVSGQAIVSRTPG